MMAGTTERDLHKPTGEPDDLETVRRGTHEVNYQHSWLEFRGITPRRTTDLNPKGGGDKSMYVKREDTEDVYVHVLQGLNDMVKAELPEASSPAVEPHTHREHV